MSILQSLRSTVPAIFAEHPAPVVSPNYKFFSTLDIMGNLEKNGWQVQKAQQVKTRDPERRPFAKHLITLVHSSLPFQNTELGSIRPTLNVINSHNHTSKLLGILGLFRLLCTNGAMVCVGDVFGISLRHDQEANIPELTEKFTTQGVKILEKAKHWSQIQLTESERTELAVEGRRIRFGEDSNIDPHALLMPRRSADEGNDLWNVFNRIQEHITQGGQRFAGMRRQARQIQNIDKIASTNLGLWSAAEKLALAHS